jgi:D-galactarolactone cycloisomerase
MMKITDIKTFVVKQELECGQAFAYSQYWYNSRTIMLLKIETDQGITGWGEAFGPAAVHKAIVDDVYKPMVLGRDPFDSEVIWEELYNKLRDHGQKGLSVEAISAIDIALWDVKGKALNMPVYKLLGGSPRTRVMPYATGLYRTGTLDYIASLAKEAEEYVQQGFRAIKMKIGFGIENDVQAIKEVRRAIGDDVILMVDANHAYNANNAIKLGRRIEEYDIFWFEEPVPPEDIEGYVEVKANISIPVAGGEAEFTRYGFYNLLHRRAVDIVQPDCCVTGGISEFKKIAMLASVHNIQCYPHIWGSAIALHAGIHCAFSLPCYPPSLCPDDVLLELDRTPNIFRERLSKRKPVIKDGYIERLEEPGLGLEIDEEFIERYRIDI